MEIYLVKNHLRLALLSTSFLLLVSTNLFADDKFPVTSVGNAVINLSNADDTLILSPSFSAYFDEDEFGVLLEPIFDGPFLDEGIDFCGPVDIAYEHNGETGVLTDVRRLTINARGGQNSVSLRSGLNIEGDIRIVTGTGTDQITMYGTSTCGRSVSYTHLTLPTICSV